ncbi:MAG TPA: hypothetical protein GXZ47_06350 [Treponema sp.]|nr:hypothetical protein [Treponema sp.]
MLKNIVFQDNLFQLCRSIDVVYEGLLLDLCSDYFFDKTVDDMLFFDASIQKMYRQIQDNNQVSDYVSILHSLYACQERFIRLLDSILKGKTSMSEHFTGFLSKLQTIRNIQSSLRSEISSLIHKSDKTMDNRDIVSSNELSELLNF